MSPHQEKLIAAATRSGIQTEDLSADWGQDAVRYRSTGKQEVVFEGNALGSTTMLAMALCNDLPVSRNGLRHLEIPTPIYTVVKLSDTTTDKASLLSMMGTFWTEGKAYACRPAFANDGTGIANLLNSVEDLEIHLDRHAADYATWCIEEPAEGDDLQLLVVDGRLVSAILRSPLKLQGNGSLTLEEMIDAHNAETSEPDHVQIDADTRQLLREQSVYLSEIVPAGQWVQLKNASAGLGGAHEVADRLHPRYAAWAQSIYNHIGAKMFAIECKARDVSADPNLAASVTSLQARPNWLAFQDASGNTADIAKLILDAMFKG